MIERVRGIYHLFIFVTNFGLEILCLLYKEMRDIGIKLMFNYEIAGNVLNPCMFKVTGE